MSLATVFTFLSKAFAKISIAFSLFFVVLSASFYFGIISDEVFNILFFVLIIMILIDTAIKFVLKQHETIYLHRLEQNYIDKNYLAYRVEIIKKKKDENTSSEAFVSNLGKEVVKKAVSKVMPKSETEDEKIARLENELSVLKTGLSIK